MKHNEETYNQGNLCFAFRALLVQTVALFTLSTSVFAQNSDVPADIRLATASFISEIMTCGVFYSIIAAGEDNTGNQWQGGERYENLSEQLFLFAYGLAEEIGMKTETLTAMANDNSKHMGEAIDFDAINIRILTEKYGDFCKTLVENPEERMAYWLLKELE